MACKTVAAPRRGALGRFPAVRRRLTPAAPTLPVRRAGPPAPPAALRRPGVRFENVALVPANLLPLKARYQALANQLPRGQVLVVLPAEASASRHLLERAVQSLRTKGRHVTTVTPTRGVPTQR